MLASNLMFQIIVHSKNNINTPLSHPPTNMHKITLIILLSILASCQNQDRLTKQNPICFNVGFEDLKTHQGIYNDSETNDEEVYFFKSRYNPCIQFYDLNGNLTDSISLTKIEDDLGLLDRVAIISKDSIIIISYSTGKIAGVKRNGEYHFKLSLDSLNEHSEDNYFFFTSIIPTTITHENGVLLIPYWNGSKQEISFTSQFDFYKYIVNKRLRIPQICKVDLSNEAPLLKYGLEYYYYNISPELKPYFVTASVYAILNNRLFFFNAFERDLYELSPTSLEVINKTKIVPDKYEIPQSYVIDSLEMEKPTPEEEELKNKCYIVNILYDKKEKKYFLFLKNGIDSSAVDELGYPFIVYTYNEAMQLEKETAFDTNSYIPKSAMMTSKGILIEKAQEEYGKKVFEIIRI